MKYSKLLLLFLIMPATNTHSMDRLLVKRYEKKQHNGRSRKMVLVPTKKENQVKKVVPYIPAEFCTLLNEKIFTISSFLSHCSSLDEAAKLLRNLNVNRFFNYMINDKEYTRAYNRQLSDQFGSPHLSTAKQMGTSGAKIFYVMQKSFRPGGCNVYTNPAEAACWTGDDLEYNEHLVKTGFFDVNCRYDNDRYPTLLLQKCSNARGFWPVAKWLIEKGADINAICSSGNNPFMLTLLCNEFALIPTFVNHKDFKPNHQNHKGEAVLHIFLDCINSFEHPNVKNICSIIVEILIKGANSTLVNRQGKTPLMIAHTIKKEAVKKEIVALLENFKN